MTWPPEGIDWFYSDDFTAIAHGDCREILPKLPKVDLVLTDPPYGHADRWSGGTWAADPMYDDAQRWDREPPSAETLSMVIGAGEDAIVWGGNYFRLPPSRCWLAWTKPPIPTMADFELAWTSFDRPSKSLYSARNPNGNGSRQHPTQKPFALIRWCLDFAPETKTILDPFMGSGTTLVAAKKLGRRAIGIEVEQKYCKIAVERLRQDNLPFVDDAPGCVERGRERIAQRTIFVDGKD